MSKVVATVGINVTYLHTLEITKEEVQKEMEESPTLTREEVLRFLMDTKAAEYVNGEHPNCDDSDWSFLDKWW